MVEEIDKNSNNYEERIKITYLKCKKHTFCIKN